ncbi:uncharacterized protein LOC115440348 [Manduca sexta]|uniref:uncharacterized protein LOC115440348 n=1 Tax=Manduca sexta TaxID=7130 RepID=UPI00188E06A7|nr:uncharacterized protein LOC115440348 [Manduca sexta]
MALMSSEENNENTQSTKISSRTKYKQSEKKKQKLKKKLKLTGNVISSNYERDGQYNLQTHESYISNMLSTYQFYSNYVYPVIAEWSPVIPVQNPVYSIHLPLVVNPVQVVTTYPYIGVVPSAVPSPVTPIEEIVHNLEPLLCYDELHKEENRHEPYFSLQYDEHCLDNYKQIAEVDDFTTYSREINERVQEVEEITYHNNKVGDPLEFYLTLPKELFPPARTLSVDPNPIIDEFCKIPNIQKHAPWILDLEFGVPNLPITRPIPTYNVKLNSVNCKNTPDAIHPGFESCGKDFKDVFLFYYDCVISTWYRGYIILNNDRSVENFQSWLLLPAQVLGMCWS